MSGQTCGRTRHGFVCGLPVGHNKGHLDLPDNHQPVRFEPGQRVRVVLDAVVKPEHWQEQTRQAFGDDHVCVEIDGGWTYDFHVDDVLDWSEPDGEPATVDS